MIGLMHTLLCEVSTSRRAAQPRELIRQFATFFPPLERRRTTSRSRATAASLSVSASGRRPLLTNKSMPLSDQLLLHFNPEAWDSGAAICHLLGAPFAVDQPLLRGVSLLHVGRPEQRPGSEVHVPIRRPHLAPGLVDVDLDAVPGAVVLQVAGVVADGELLAELLHDAAEDGLDVGAAVDALDAAATLLDG